jgi:cyanophycinase-like exopeptidase
MVAYGGLAPLNPLLHDMKTRYRVSEIALGVPNSAGVMMMSERSYVSCKSKSGEKTSTDNPALGTESQDNRIARGA